MNILQICQELTKEVPSEQIYMNEPMSKHTTFKVGGNADIFIKIKSINELRYLIKVAKKRKIPIYFIGNGSNLLVKDKGVRGIVAKIEFEDIKIIEDNKYNFIITVEAGVKLMYLSHWLLERGITGFEFASRNSWYIRRSN